MSIADKITRLNTAKTAIASAITAKGGTVSSGDGFEDFATDISGIPSGSSGENVAYNIDSSLTIPSFSLPNGVTINGNTYSLSDEKNFKPFGSYGLFYPLDENGNTFSFQLSEKTEFRFIIKFKITDTASNQRNFIGWTYSGQYGQLPEVYIDSGTIIVKDIYGKSQYEISLNTWYYLCIYWDDTNKCEIVSMYNENGILLKKWLLRTYSSYPYTSSVSTFYFGGCYSSSGQRFNKGYFSIDETLIEMNNTVVWGETNSKTLTMGKFDYNFHDLTQFQQVEYIGSTANGQFINTKVTELDGLEVQYKITNNSSSESNAIIGNNSGGDTGRLAIIDYNGELIYSPFTARGVYDQNIHTVKYGSFNDWKLNIDGTDVEQITEPTILTPSTDENRLFDLGSSSSSSIVWSDTEANIYYCKMYKDGSLVRDFVPCYHKAFGNIGLFDKVNNVFYENAGTGTFTKGADV